MSRTALVARGRENWTDDKVRVTIEGYVDFQVLVNKPRGQNIDGQEAWLPIYPVNIKVVCGSHWKLNLPNEALHGGLKFFRVSPAILFSWEVEEHYQKGSSGHPMYKDTVRWRGTKTADIAFVDFHCDFTRLLSERGYLDVETWRWALLERSIDFNDWRVNSHFSRAIATSALGYARFPSELSYKSSSSWS